MISDVVLVGIAKENLKRGFRYFDIDSINPLTESKVHSLIIVSYWTKEKVTRLNRIKKETPVVIKGHIEIDEEYGLFIVAESIYLCCWFLKLNILIYLRMSNVGRAAVKRIFTLLHAYFSWILPYSRKPSRQPLSIKFKKLKYFVLKLNKSLNADMHVKGTETLPTDVKCCFLPNHLSAYDPMIISSMLPDATTYLSKVENKKIPIVGRIIAAMEGCFLDRSNFQKAIEAMLYIEKDLSEQTKNWVIFPEGTRNKDPLAPLLEFHKGSFRAIMKAHAPIVPVALYGTQNVLKSKYRLKRFPVYLTFLKPLMPEDYAEMTPDEVREKVKNMIQEEVNIQRKAYFDELETCFRSKRALKKYLQEKPVC